MIPDKRKTKRRQFRRTAQILVLPNDRYPCALSDVSDIGARLEVDDSRKLPDRFFLLLTAHGKVQRACQVVWRKPTQVGVKFHRSITAVDQSTLLPQSAISNEAPACAEPD